MSTQNIIHGNASCSPKKFLTAIIYIDQWWPSDTESLRRQCTEKGLPNNGQKNALIPRLLQHGTTSSLRPTVDAAGNANLPSTSTSPQRDNPQSSLFTEDYLVQIRYHQLFLVARKNR